MSGTCPKRRISTASCRVANISYSSAACAASRNPSSHNKISALLELFGLTSAADQSMSGYSKRMRQKVLIVAALLHDPDVLILDEPESGLDLTAGLVLRHLIPLLAARGKIIVYSSHLLDRVEQLCADVVVLHRGRIVAQGPVRQLRAMIQSSASLEDVVAELVSMLRSRADRS